MVSSFQMKAFVVATCCSLVSARSSQQPSHAPESKVEAQSEAKIGANFDALNRGIFLITPAAPIMDKKATDMRCKTTPFDTSEMIMLPADSCLSGETFSNSNIQFKRLPSCADGSIPMWSYWYQNKCEGEPIANAPIKQSDIGRDFCIWSGPMEGWSMIFRCNPPAKVIPSDVDQSADAVIVSHLSPACSGYTVGGDKPFNLKPDRQCVTTPGYSFHIKQAPTCANGTRALWARFEDPKCGDRKISKRYGLVELKDSDIGKCLSTGPVGSDIKVMSMAFWCDGFNQKDEKEPQQKPQQKLQQPQQQQFEDDDESNDNTIVWVLIGGFSGLIVAILGIYLVCCTNFVGGVKHMFVKEGGIAL